MNDKDKQPAPINYFLEPGFIYLATRPTIISGVVGSCAAVCLYDRKKKIGGMNLFELPYMDDRRRATARYGNVATLALIRMLLENGSKIKHLEAQIVGGAHNEDVSSRNIGRQNVQMARRVLIQKRIRIVSEDVGGAKGRKIVFNTETNEVAVIKVDRLRSSDWYPYEGQRDG